MTGVRCSCGRVNTSLWGPRRFLKTACRVIRKGYGFPSIFNADAVVQELVRQGKSLEDARAGGTSGCIEAGAFGKEAYILTGYLNLPKILELALHDGFDPRTLPNPTDPELLLRPTGRGIFYMRRFMNRVEFSRAPGGIP